MRRSSLDTNDYTQFDSTLNAKNSAESETATEMHAIHPRLLKFIPPNSCVP